jgi:tRNA A-37 threonylcarbamoyl transferase component Bud32
MQCPSCQAPVDGTERFCGSCGASLTSAEPADPLVGQTLNGKYRVTRKLGEGGMGAVYEGEQPLGTARRRVAIKTLHPHLSRDPTIEERFRREVGTIAELEHPNTIQVYDFGSTEQAILYIVMEYLQGKSLADVLTAEGAMPPLRAQNIVLQTCGSLEEAHARGIVHRDLKPDNLVLIERAGIKDFVKVLDFGIAKRAREEDKNEQKLTQQGMVLGTPPYMSPEQFTGKPIDARSDIYSLGIMAYEMLTGQLPFKADTAWEWATQHMTQPPIPIESVAGGAQLPQAMQSAIVRSLAKSPDDRFQSMREFGEAFASKSSVATKSPPPRLEPQAEQRTEIGRPLDVAAAFGDAGMAPFGAKTPYTPAAGNVAFPTPAVMEQLSNGEKPGRGRAALLAAAAVIGIASSAAIVFAVRGGSSAPKELVFDNAAAPAPATSLAPATVASGDTPSKPEPAASIPPLSGAGGGNRPRGGPHNGPSPSASRSEGQPGHADETPSALAVGPFAGVPPFPAASQIIPPELTVLPKAESTPAPSASAAKYDGPECQRARTLRAVGRARAAEAWAGRCTAKGGTP